MQPKPCARCAQMPYISPGFICHTEGCRWAITAEMIRQPKESEMAEKMTLEQVRDRLRKYATDADLYHDRTRQTLELTSAKILADAIDAHLSQLAQAVDVERVLAALGHVRAPNTRCLARVAETAPELRPPGPQNPPMWCCLQEGHEGQHRHNSGGMYPSIPFRDTDEVVMVPLPDHCEKCRSIWPCDDAKAITRAIGTAHGWIPIDQFQCPEYEGDCPRYIYLYREGMEPDGGYQMQIGNGIWLANRGKEHGVTHCMPLPTQPTDGEG